MDYVLTADQVVRLGGGKLFEAGKEYKTRDGRRARVYAVDGEEPYPIHGAYQYSGNGWQCRAWTREGHGTELSCPTDADLMPPEPERRTVWLSAWRDKAGFFYAVSTSREDALAAIKIHDRAACVPVTFAEGEGLSLMADCFRAEPKIGTAELLEVDRWG